MIVHGYAEHSARYNWFAEHLQASNFACTTFDLRGYGQSEGTDAYINDFTEYIDDLVTIVNEIDRPADLPLVAMGHSMGGLVVLKAVLDKVIDPDAIILSSPALAFFEHRILQNMGSVISRIAPKLPTVKLDRTLVSRDPVVVGNALSDPLCYHGRVKARTGSEMVRVSRDVARRFTELEHPLLILHGTGDKITDHRASQSLFDAASSEDKTIRLFDDAYHELLNDFTRDEVAAEITRWLANRFQASTGREQP